LPLKLQHQIAETVGEVVTEEQRAKFIDISKNMVKVLRRDIMDDQGNSNLKKKVLDLITNLRLEEQLLNDTKTGPNSNKKGNFKYSSTMKVLNKTTLGGKTKVPLSENERL